MEIYINGYVKDVSKADDIYSWEELVNIKDIVQYDESKGELQFNLGKYMEKNNISKDKVITFRFVD